MKVPSFSTGILALDKILHGVMPGDNIVFQIDSIKDFIPFVHAFCIDKHKQNRTLIYFRFADHVSLIPEDVKAEVFQVHPEKGFENFIDEIFKVIEKYGKGGAYVFDCLSDLAVDWYSDHMVANFFMLTCPYLYDFETETFFSLLRGRHSENTVLRIHQTAQIIIDVYQKDEKYYIQPIKVWKRYSPTMYMLHVWNDKKFTPLRKSSEISEILAEYAQPWVDFTTKIQDIWSKTFNQAYEKLDQLELGTCKYEDITQLKEKIIRMIITRDPKLFLIAKEYFDLEDLLSIGKRIIGTGLIGGKSVGMLLAQAILKKNGSKWQDKLERHDSFFIGSDVFYTYLVANDCWWLRYNIRKTKDFKELATKGRELLESGDFPNDIIEQFRNMLNYFGQSPIIVRSSSLLEDAYGNAFSGKYDSIFIANQGTPKERLNNFVTAIKKVYKSTLSEKALYYRLNRDLLDKDEQMAILVQRVSGTPYGNYFYPQLAGVGYSYNPFVWNEEIIPEAGLIRVVFGLGTRAVERYDDDYTRIVALSAPNLRPESSSEDKQKYNQRKIDIIDLKNNVFSTKYFDKLILESKNFPVDIFASRDYEIEDKLAELGAEQEYHFLDLDKNILSSPIIKDLQEILQALAEVYKHPIDIEFTVNYVDDNFYKIYVLQCRPFQVKSKVEKIEEPKAIKSENILMKSVGPIIGNGIIGNVDRLIYVRPEAYGKLSAQERYKIARIIGRLNYLQKQDKNKTYFLAGPGRWATSSPSLGVPVAFQEIDSISIICEIAEMHQDLVPNISLGTHFFNDLVESDMLYLAIDPKVQGSILNKAKILQMKNYLSELLPEAENYQDIIKVIQNSNGSNKELKMQFYADPVKQIAILFLE
jgi:hypothetical protein